MKPGLLYDDVAYGLSKRLFEGVQPDSSFEGRISLALAMLDELLIAIFGRADIGSRFEPSACGMTGVACCRREFKRCGPGTGRRRIGHAEILD